MLALLLVEITLHSHSLFASTHLKKWPFDMHSKVASTGGKSWQFPASLPGMVSKGQALYPGPSSLHFLHEPWIMFFIIHSRRILVGSLQCYASASISLGCPGITDSSDVGESGDGWELDDPEPTRLPRHRISSVTPPPAFSIASTVPSTWSEQSGWNCTFMRI